jgi:hypothetical protein
MSLKNPVTPPGIDPGTVRLVAQRLNHYSTPGPSKAPVFLLSNAGTKLHNNPLMAYQVAVASSDARGNRHAAGMPQRHHSHSDVPTVTSCLQNNVQTFRLVRIAFLALSIPPSVSAIITSAYQRVITFSPTHYVIAITRNTNLCFFLQPATFTLPLPGHRGVQVTYHFAQIMNITTGLESA